jgi:hypothetical protein
VALVEARQEQARAEVEEAHAIAVADHDVVGLHVAVHDADLVRGAQDLGEIDRQAERALGLDLPVLERGGERDAVHDLHGEVRLGSAPKSKRWGAPRSIAASARASRRNLCSRFCMPALRGWIVLSATRRRASVSNAICTRPMPPCPSSPHRM